MKKSQFQYIEDNGGGLHLFIFRDGVVTDAITNLEYADAGEGKEVYPRLLKDAEDEVATWEGHVADVIDITANDFYATFLDDITSAVVADEEGIYPYRMGAAAARYFHVDIDDFDQFDQIVYDGREFIRGR